MELSRDLDISLIFNVVDIYEFCEGESNEEIGIPTECKKQLLVKPSKERKKFWSLWLGRRLATRSI